MSITLYFGIEMKIMDTKISLGRMYYPVKVLGPGNRVGIWLNGCKRSCLGCISPELQKYDKSKEVTVSELMQMINRIETNIDGFTISGGEPFYKPTALNELVQSLATVSDDIIIFSGYTLEELKSKNDESIESTLSVCSVLIDGPYIKDLSDTKGLRGSSNQRCWVFKHKDKYVGIDSDDRMLQNIVYSNKLVTIGIPQGE